MSDWVEEWINVKCKRCGSEGRIGGKNFTPEEKYDLMYNWGCCPDPPSRLDKLINRLRKIKWQK